MTDKNAQKMTTPTQPATVQPNTNHSFRVSMWIRLLNVAMGENLVATAIQTVARKIRQNW